MAVTKDNVISLSELCNYINTNVVDYIQSQIQYYKENPPPNFSGNEDYLHSGTTLETLTPDIITNSNDKISFNVLYEKLQQLFKNWALVRIITHTYYVGNNTNGGTITYTSNEYSGYAYLTTDPEDNSLTLTNLLNTKITTDHLSNIVSKIKNRWFTVASADQQNTDTTNCHTNCHSSCHGNCHGNCHGSSW